MTLDEEKTLAKLEYIRRNLNSIDYGELVREIGRLVPILPFTILNAKNINSEGRQYSDLNTIFRSRANKYCTRNSSTKMPYKTVDEIGLNKDYEKIPMGRCNKVKEAMFYGSFSFPTAALESITKGTFPQEEISTSCTISEWSIVEPLKLAVISHSMISLKEIHAKFFPALNDYQKKEHLELQDLCIEKRNKLVEYLCDKGNSKDYSERIIDFFSYEFAKSKIETESDYKLSNCFVDRVFNDREMFDAIYYPSIHFMHNRDNIVIHPRAMHKIKFNSAMYVGIHYFPNNNQTQFDPWEQNIQSNEHGELEWIRYKWKDEDKIVCR